MVVSRFADLSRSFPHFPQEPTGFLLRCFPAMRHAPDVTWISTKLDFGTCSPRVRLAPINAHEAPMSIFSGLLSAIDLREALRLFRLFR